MILFFTIVLLLVTIYRLIKGNFANEFTLELLKAGDEELRQLDEDRAVKLILKTIGFIVFAFAYTFAYLIYLVNAFNYDIYVLPTLLMLVWFVVSFIVGWIRGKAYKRDKQKAINKLSKKRTASGTLGDLITIIYFIYMFVILVF